MSELKEKFIGKIPGVEVNFPVDPWHEFVSRDNIRLHTYFYPSEAPKACMVMFHGLSSHSNISASFAEEYSATCHVFAIDQRGHGKSGGKPGSVPHFSKWVEDSIDFTLAIYREFRLPIFLHGESMGGTIAIEVAAHLNDIVKGLVLLAPALETSANNAKLWECVIRTLVCCCPCLCFPRGTPDGISKNPHVSEYIIEEDLVYKGKRDFKTIVNVLDGMKNARSKAPIINASMIIVFGSDDIVTCIKKARNFFDSVQVEDKTFYEVSGGRHALVLDTEAFEIKEMVGDWVRERTY